MNELPKLEEKYEKTILDSIRQKKLNISEQEDLIILFEDFYKKHGTFSIFENSKNQKYQNAINKIKKDEQDKQKLSQLYLIETNIKPYKQNNNEHILHNNIYNYNNHKSLTEDEMKIISERIEKCHKTQKNIISNKDKLWEQKKENDNLKFNTNTNTNNVDTETKLKEEKFKNFYIQLLLKEAAFPSEQFKKYINVLKDKKRKEIEKNPFHIHDAVNLDVVYGKDQHWDIYSNTNNEVSSVGNDVSKVETITKNTSINYDILVDNSIMKSIIKIDHLEKSNVNLNNNDISKQFKLTDTRKVIPGYIQNQSGNDYSGVSGKNEEMFRKSELWQNFERDFHKFMKEDYP